MKIDTENMSGVQKSSPKLLALTKWKKVKEVNKMLDDGISPLEVCRWINKNGFAISKPLVYDYARMRRAMIVKDMAQADMVTAFAPKTEKPADILRIPILTAAEMKTPEYKDTKKRIRSELQLLDHLIEKGWETLMDFGDRPISPKMAMEAISLKDRITNGGHMHLTEYGMQNLREVEQEKYRLVITALMAYVPEDYYADAIAAIEKTEDDFYKRTAYYEDYLRAAGHSDDEIWEIMERLRESDLDMEE